MRMKPYFFIILILAISMILAATAVLLRDGSDESSVDSAAIQASFTLEHSIHLDHEPQFLLLDRTDSGGMRCIPQFHAKKLNLKIFLRLEYCLKNSFSSRIPATLRLPPPHSRVAQEELRKFSEPGFLSSAPGK